MIELVLTQDEVRQALEGLAGWELAGEEITRQFGFPDFREAVSFVVRVAFEAEAANHHPDLDIRYNKVRVTLSTHSEGGVTAKDVELAQAMNGLGPA